MARAPRRFLTHAHPRQLPRAALAWRRTWGLGGLAVLLTTVVAATGVLLAVFYEPDAGSAAASIQRVAYLVPFGWLVRNLHYWAAQALLVVALLHLVRVLAHGAFRGRKALNWVVGLAVAVAVVWADFSGYVLRWDVAGREALTTGASLTARVPGIGTGLAAALWGEGTTPLRSYFWHCFGSAAIGGVLLAYHLWRVRRDGGVALPARVATSGSGLKPAAADFALVGSDELVRRELLASGVALAALTAVAVLSDAPLTLAGDARAPWFFYPVQLLVARGDPFWLGVVLPLAPLVALAALPWIPGAGRRGGASDAWSAGTRSGDGTPSSAPPRLRAVGDESDARRHDRDEGDR
jgi:quinol-cytochrome oxidoreductase complex cytochrome b subunit